MGFVPEFGKLAEWGAIPRRSDDGGRSDVQTPAGIDPGVLHGLVDDHLKSSQIISGVLESEVWRQFTAVGSTQGAVHDPVGVLMHGSPHLGTIAGPHNDSASGQRTEIQSHQIAVVHSALLTRRPSGTGTSDRPYPA